MQCLPTDRPRHGLRDIPVNGQALSLFRILFASLLLYDLFANVLPAWDFLYSATGVLSAGERNSAQIWSLFTYSDNTHYARIVISLYTVALLGFLAGYKTRFCTILVLWGYASIVDRNLAANSNAELLAQGLLLWSCFLPMARYWSFDAALRDESERTKPWPFIPVLAIRVQIMIVYLYAGLYKLADPHWLSGDAIRYAVSDRFYGTQFGDYILGLLPATALSVTTWAVMLFQIIFSFLVYAPVRNDLFRAIALGGAALMHLSFLFFLQVGIFPVLCLFYLLFLVPDHWIEKMLQKRREYLGRIRIYYDPDCGFCRNISLLFREFCLGPAAQAHSAEADEQTLNLLRATNSWVVHGADGKTYLKWRAVSYVLKQSPLFWIIGQITGAAFLAKPMEKFYDLIGRNRQRLGAKFSMFFHSCPEKPPGYFAQAFCLFCLGLLLTYTTLYLPDANAEIPRKIRLAAHQFGVNQVWNIFAVDVTSWEWNMHISGYDRDGKDVDIRPLIAGHYHPGHGGFYIFSSHRILKFYSRTFYENEERNRQGLARYLCTEGHRRDLPLAGVRMAHGQKRLHGDYSWERGASSYQCSAILLRP